MNPGHGPGGQLVDDELTVQSVPTVHRPRGPRPPRAGDGDRWEAEHEVDLTDGPGADDAAADGAPVAPSASVRPPQPVLGATLRPPLTGPGQPQRPLVGDALREALASHPASPPLAPPTDRYAAPEGYPPSPYDGTGGGYADAGYAASYAPAAPVAPPGPSVPSAPSAPTTVDPAEAELWFHPRVEPAPTGEPPSRSVVADPSTVAIVLPTPEPLPGAGPVRPLSRRARRAAEHALGSAPAPAPGVGVPAPSPQPPMQPAMQPAMQPVDDELPGLADTDEWVEMPSFARPASVADHPAPLPPLPVSSPVFSARPAPAMPAGPAFGAPPPVAPPVAPPPAVMLPPAPPAPSPLSGPVGLFPGLAPAPSPAAPTPGVMPTSPDAGAAPSAPVLPTGPVTAGPASAGPAAGMPAGMPAPTGPDGVRARSHRSSEGPSTSSIPIIRPPVQVRRPDESAMSSTTETRSLRVTPPDAKALFRTPVGPKGTDKPAQGPATGSPTVSAPPAANVAPPSPAEAPPPPVAPKTQVEAGPPAVDADSGRTRKVVIVPGSVTGSVSWTPRSTPPAPPTAAAPEPAAPARHDRPAGDAAMADWLGELRGDEAPLGAQPGGFGTGGAPTAETVVPVRGREARQNRKAATKARKAEQKVRREEQKLMREAQEAPRAGQHTHREEDAARHADLDDLDGPERGRLLSLLVFWAPALILLMLAGVVIWLVR